MLALIAAAEGLDPARDFPAVLDIAGNIAGLDPLAPEPKRRPPPPPMVPLASRVAEAQKRAAWVWSRLQPNCRAGSAYLESRGLRFSELCRLEDLKFTPVAATPAQCKTDGARRMVKSYSIPSVCLPVRHVETGELVDVRARRYEPDPDQPKIVGMAGGVTREAGELVGCYGKPHALKAATPTIVCEGWADYLTALSLWPERNVLGSVDAGSFPLVASFAAQHVAEHGGGRLVLFGQMDGPEGAAPRSIDIASARAWHTLGAGGVITMFSGTHKDFNEWMCARGRGEALAALRHAEKENEAMVAAWR